MAKSKDELAAEAKARGAFVVDDNAPTQGFKDDDENVACIGDDYVKYEYQQRYDDQAVLDMERRAEDASAHIPEEIEEATVAAREENADAVRVYRMRFQEDFKSWDKGRVIWIGDFLGMLQKIRPDAFLAETSYMGPTRLSDRSPASQRGQAILKVYGANTSLDLCHVDGAQDLKEHVEILRINLRDGEKTEAFEITVPNAVGFLLLKTSVARFREEPKDAYDIYYYCRYSEDPLVIRKMLANAVHEPAITRAVDNLKRKFTHIDSKWVEMVLDEMSLTGDDRDREAQFVVRSVGRVIEGL